MKRLAAVALLTLGLAIPLCAQRGASHSGSSGHSAPAFRGGSFAAPTSAPRLSGAPRYTGSVPLASRPSPRTPYNPAVRPAYGNNRGRWNYAWRYRNGVPYLSPVWIGPGLFGSDLSGYPDTASSDDSYAPSDAPGGYNNMPPPPPEVPLAPAPNPAWSAPPPPQPEPAPADAVTLVFRDGRPTEQIRNYIMTRTTLYISDQHRREIPLDQLDLVATEKINRAAGIDFSVPGTR